MKHIKCLFVLFFISFSVIGFSQDDQDLFGKKNALKINPFVLANAEIRISYERFLNDRRSSISLIPSYSLREQGDEKIVGWQIMSQYKFYLTHINKTQGKTFLNLFNYGFYCGLYAVYNDFESDYEQSWWNPDKMQNETDIYHLDVNAFEGGAMVGIQTDITERIVFDFYVGGGLRDGTVTDTFDDIQDEIEYYDEISVFDQKYKGVKPRIGFQLGITF